MVGLTSNNAHLIKLPTRFTSVLDLFLALQTLMSLVLQTPAPNTCTVCVALTLQTHAPNTYTMCVCDVSEKGMRSLSCFCLTEGANVARQDRSTKLGKSPAQSEDSCVRRTRF